MVQLLIHVSSPNIQNITPSYCRRQLTADLNGNDKKVAYIVVGKEFVLSCCAFHSAVLFFLLLLCMSHESLLFISANLQAVSGILQWLVVSVASFQSFILT